MGSNEQFVRQRRGGGNCTTDIRYVVPILSQMLVGVFVRLSFDFYSCHSICKLEIFLAQAGCINIHKDYVG
jgi:hypothetical protein